MNPRWRLCTRRRRKAERVLPARTCGAGEQHPYPLEDQHIGDQQRHALLGAGPRDAGMNLLLGQPIPGHSEPASSQRSARASDRAGACPTRSPWRRQVTLLAGAPRLGAQVEACHASDNDRRTLPELVLYQVIPDVEVLPVTAAPLPIRRASGVTGPAGS